MVLDSSNSGFTPKRTIS